MSAPGFEPKKVLGLIKHPNNSMKLEPKDDWLYGFIASAIGILGFAIWFWALQNGFVRSLSFFADLVYSAAIGGASVGKSLWAGIVSIIVIVVVLTAAGNRLGESKRGWMEASAYLGGTQAWFGAAYLVNGLIAFVLWKFSLVLMIGLLLLNLCTLLFAAVELHEVTSGRRFVFFGIVIGVYVIAIGVLYTMF
ncbi:hypothetical protein [Cohnella candidum]|uniref:hypothetical protein n=1 Tax=Cohnella candidum TaxID=2674991 RepID=UPI0013DE016F|nr:hypothetical protein [Cohnella candidum]